MANATAPRSSLRSVALVTGLSLVQLLVQFAIQLLLARLFGAASEMDAFVAALAAPVVVAMILSGSLGYVLVPVFAEQMAVGGRPSATAVAGQIGLYLTVISLLATLAMVLAAQPLAAILCPGFSSDQLALTARLLRVLAGLIVANSLIAFCSAVHHCEGCFAWPALAGVIGTIVTLGTIAVLSPQQGIGAAATGVMVGAATTAGLMLPKFFEHLRQPLARALSPHAATRRALVLLAPLVVGAIYWRLDPLVDRWLGSFLPAGSIAHLGYAWRLTAALMMVGTSGLSVVAFPAIAAHAAAGRARELNGEIAHALRLLAFLLVPISVGLGLFASPVVQLLFEHGRFTAADTQAVAALLVLYLGAVFGASLGDVLSRTLYALHDTRTPVIVSTAIFTIAIGLKLLLVRQWGAAGLAAATSAYYVLNAALLVAILLHRQGGDMLAGVGESLVRSTVSALVACGAAWLVGHGWTPFGVLPAAVTGAVVYAIVARLLGDEFTRLATERLGRLWRRNNA